MTSLEDLKKELFQFQTGAIKRLRPVGFQGLYTRFNSKLVRLKEIIFDLPSDNIIMFQFQTGAIKRKTAVMKETSYYSFNSKLVRLKEEIANQLNAMKSSFNSKLVRLKETHHLS